ncbi:helical backbone metal receptor [Comamonas sp.]|uniref:ABC transporter substrate-binding protein n=1 Tax=Comamonas sp. TaxID=34028 RepID=UPI002896E3CC|nr:helical backbone metal receptor [Comamonas sp.]
MNALLRRRLCAVLGMGALALGMVHAQAADVPAGVPENALKDDRGRLIARAQPPQRIVSLLPSLTETVCVMGACDHLVGVDRYSNWPEKLLTTLPVLGGGLDPNVEAIVALKPDVVLLSNSARVVDRLEALGLRTVALEPRTQADVYRVLHSIGLLLGLPPEQGAEREWRRMQAGMDAAAQSLPAGVRGTKVYFEVSRGPFVAGPSSFIGELLTRMQVGNVVPNEMGPFPRLNPEFILRARPDVILMGNHSMQVAHTYPGWYTLDAVKHQRVCAFDARESGVIVRPGPRMDEAARIIARCLAEKAPRRGG